MYSLYVFANDLGLVKESPDINNKNSMEKNLSQLADEIKSAISSFNDDMEKAVEGNKSAGQRSRKQSLNLEKLFKEWRKVSVNL